MTETELNWGPWRWSWFSDWCDGDWRYTWSFSMILPRIAIQRADNGDLNTVMVHCFLIGVMWSRSCE